MKRSILLLTVFLFLTITAKNAQSEEVPNIIQIDQNFVETATDDDETKSPNHLPDPLYYFNLATFHFNDKFYYWLVEPVTSGYKFVTPEVARVGLGHAIDNFNSPVNIVNNLLQFKFKRTGLELLRFVFNTTVGVAGFYDASYHLLDIDKQEADFGQTLGYYGIGQGIYLVWPILGPSSLRETIGFAGDQMMTPSTYVGYFFLNFLESSALVATEKINNTSFKLGDYEFMTGSAVDPYDALKNSFVQYRNKKIRQANEH